MAMSQKLLRPRARRFTLALSAADYIAAVEAADGEPLEDAVRAAITEFFTGCAADGNSAALQAGCVLMGARTLAGALVPLVGPAPRNYGFVAGDYSRTLGLLGDGVAKYLDTGFNHSAVPQDNYHMAYAGTFPVGWMMGRGFGLESRASVINVAGQAATEVRLGARCGSVARTISGSAFAGASRSSAASFTTHTSAGGSQDHAAASASPLSGNVFVFATNYFNDGTAYVPTACRCQYYSLGLAVNLSALSARVAALRSAIAAAITVGPTPISLWKAETFAPSYHWSM